MGLVHAMHSNGPLPQVAFEHPNCDFEHNAPYMMHTPTHQPTQAKITEIILFWRKMINMLKMSSRKKVVPRSKLQIL
jgi:hypothetical protein